MLVFVVNRRGKPLMPCSPPKARHLLKTGKAKVVRREPFTIKLLHGSAGYRQEVVAGMDTGAKVIACAAIGNGRVLYQSEVALRQDVSGKMQQRAMYRRTRRARKTRYRPARWNNRASMRANGRLTPSIRSKVDSHLREKQFADSLLPVTRWKVELAQFDIHKISNPDVAGAGYQNGDQKGFYNVKAYVLHRDGYQCQSGRKIRHAAKLHVHHVVFRSNGGSNAPSNLIVLCETCHDDLHAGLFTLEPRKSRTKHATEIGIVKGALLRSDWAFEPTFGYETKFKRESVFDWDKSHAADAVAIACEDGEIVRASTEIYRKRHVAKGDYQQTRGQRSEVRIPTGKLFGLRKFDLIRTPIGVGFVKGKRTRGVFVLMNLTGDAIGETNVRRNTERLSARTSTLTARARLLPMPKGRGSRREVM